MILLGTTKRGHVVRMPDAVRATNIHVIGAPGKGKSKFLQALITQDITAGRGLCLIDPHGTEYECVVEWCTRNNVLRSRPVILLDPHIPGWSFGFNPMQGDGPVSVRVDAMVKAFAQVWGGEDTNQTPTLKRCLRALLHCLMVHKLTLLEAIDLLSAVDSQRVRRFLTASLVDPVFAAEWENLNGLSRREFTEHFLSTSNRLLEFLSAPVIRSIIGQREMTINFRKCMDEGAIVLVNLARKGELSSDNARLLGTLIVNELFQRALARRPGSRPYCLYIDECYHYLNEDIENIFDQGRKFNLHMVLAHQRLGQLRKAGDHVYNAVMAGAQTKVVFGVEDFQDARDLAEQIFAGELDLSSAKAAFSRPRVTDYVPEWMLSESDGTSESRTLTRSRSRSHSLGRTLSTTRTIGHAVTRGRSISEGRSETEGESSTEGRSSMTARTAGESFSTSSGQSSGRTANYDGAFSVVPAGRAISMTRSAGADRSATASSTEALTESSSHTTSRSRTRSIAETISQSETTSESLSRGVARSETRGNTYGVSRAESAGQSRTTGRSQTFRPVLTLDRGMPKTLDELVYEAAVRLKNQRPRTAVIKMPGKTSIRFQTLSVGLPVASERRINQFKQRALAMSLVTRPLPEAEREIAARREELTSKAIAVAEEPGSFREPLPSSPARPRTRRPAR